eukprot:TRINITY_DN16962_c0_g1_i2.p1 TRINITY_DN16962_c0_g1~~TRINITY_DN16962_c0_g1_i2.p1  ORF type:complete len:117 (+),score=4.93 TRINITY_DN16962_c0_g1_i2:70-420(+)
MSKQAPVSRRAVVCHCTLLGALLSVCLATWLRCFVALGSASPLPRARSTRTHLRASSRRGESSTGVRAGMIVLSRDGSTPLEVVDVDTNNGRGEMKVKVLAASHTGANCSGSAACQ